MSKLVFNRDGGKADEYGHLLALSRLLTGDVIEGMSVTQAVSLGMSVLISPGSARISTGTSPTNYGYFAAIDTNGGESVTIATADTSNPRIDTIVAYIDLSITPSTSSANNPNNMLKLAAVAGTPATTPSAPSGSAIQSAIGASNPYIVLANISVAANATQITNSNITDKRTMATPYTVQRQNSSTTNIVETGAIIQSGWGRISNNTSANNITDSVTFKVPFTSAPIVVLTFGGDNASLTTYGSGVNILVGRMCSKAHTITSTGFIAQLHTGDGANFPAGYSFYQWIAIGK